MWLPERVGQAADIRRFAELTVQKPQKQNPHCAGFVLAAPVFGLVRLETGSVTDSVAFRQSLPFVHLNLEACGHHGFRFNLHGLFPRFFRRDVAICLSIDFWWWHRLPLHSHQQFKSIPSVPVEWLLT